MKHEYHVVQAIYPSLLQDVLNKMASESWELHSILPVNDDGQTLIFERKVIDLDAVCQE